MRMTRLIALGLIVACIPALAAAGTSAKPSLRVVDRSPLVVRGVDFRAGERVTVTALTGLGPRIARVTAVNGRFRVAFSVPTRGCAAAWAVRAKGTLGSAVLMRLAEQSTSCIPPPVD